MVACVEVDESGVSCKSGGGTTVLASHNNIYGPGGQSVFPDVKQGGAVSRRNHLLCDSQLTLFLGARVSLHQHKYWLCRLTEAVWVELAQLEHWMARCRIKGGEERSQR